MAVVDVSWMFDDAGALSDDGRLACACAYAAFAFILLRVVKRWLIRAFPSNVAAFVPYDATGKNRGDVVVVDCTHRSFPTLTHHRDSSTPECFKGDTSTDTVLNAIQHPSGWEPMRRATKVTCNHFDIDGVLSVWALINPSAARRLEPVARAAARLGDFRELPDADPRSHPTSLAALRFACWMNAEERALFSRPFEGDEAQESAKKFDHFLPLVTRALEESLREPPAAALIHEEKKDLTTKTLKESADSILSPGNALVAETLAHLAAIRSTPGAVDRWDALGVCVIDAPVATRYYAAFTFARDADYVVSLFPENAYEVEARYVGFVDFRSRPVWPRFDLAPLARALNAMEEEARRTPPRGGSALSAREPTHQNTALSWDVAGPSDTGPVLRLTDSARRLTRAERYGDPCERPAERSEIPREAFLRVTRAFFERAAREAAKHLGVEALSDVPKVGWTWGDIGAINAAADFDGEWWKA